jgi:SNF2 family DNA or RNA helicase
MEQESLFSLGKKKKSKKLTEIEFQVTIESMISTRTPEVYEVTKKAIEHFPNHFAFQIYLFYAILLSGRLNEFETHHREFQQRFTFPPEYIVLPCIIFNVIQKRYKYAFDNYHLLIRKSSLVYPDYLDKEWVEPYLDELRSWRKREIAKQRIKNREEKTTKKKALKEQEEKQKKIQKEQEEKQKKLQKERLKLEKEEQAKKELFQDFSNAIQLKPLPKKQATLSFEIKPKANHFWKEYNKPEQYSDAFLIRYELEKLSLFKVYESLLCISKINISPFSYQLETAKKVLRQFRGRVLLADEVGLGKTIEAGLILKEYIIRGLAQRVLVITPASLVGQWQEEMLSKFNLEFSSTQDALLKEDPKKFWKQNRIIASIATIRKDNQADIVSLLDYDLVIVDEAHHLKNRTSKNWKLVDRLKKKFLLLLSATPVQNNLIELYNLLTLLKPGIFKTEKDFRSVYVSPNNPRLPINKEILQDLMRDVMIRNTRSLVDIKLPPRTVLTIRIDFSHEESECYLLLNELIKNSYKENSPTKKMQFQHLLQSAGSTHIAIRSGLERYVSGLESGDINDWKNLLNKYHSITKSSKIDALIETLKKNPTEKKIIFVRHLDTLSYLSTELTKNKLVHEIFSGNKSAKEKDEAVENFRESVPILLSTESGGEGRNLQFCNTIFNFDLPWNPQAIEQRIGRIHRIGQEREIFVFNFASKNTLEDHLLKVLDEKINMFELVVGEIQSILGEIESDEDFNSIVFNAWIGSGSQEPFEQLGQDLMKAKEEYSQAKDLEDQLFGDEFEVV